MGRGWDGGVRWCVGVVGGVECECVWGGGGGVSGVGVCV